MERVRLQCTAAVGKNYYLPSLPLFRVEIKKQPDSAYPHKKDRNKSLFAAFCFPAAPQADPESAFLLLLLLLLRTVSVRSASFSLCTGRGLIPVDRKRRQTQLTERRGILAAAAPISKCFNALLKPKNWGKIC